MSDAATAGPRCPRCASTGVLPNRMDAPDEPVCACGKPSVREDGFCADDHGAVFCNCSAGHAAARPQIMIPCECSTTDHLLVFSLDRESGDLYVDVQMNQYHPWWKRVGLAVRYVFGGGGSRFGHWDETSIRVEDHATIKKLLDESAAGQAREAARRAAEAEESRRGLEAKRALDEDSQRAAALAVIASTGDMT